MLENLTLEMLGARTSDDKPVVIDFFADWCGPCKLFAPIFKRVAAAYEDRVDFAAVDADEQPELAAHFDVSNFPTILAIKDGEVVYRSINILNEPSLKAVIENLLG